MHTFFTIVLCLAVIFAPSLIALYVDEHDYSDQLDEDYVPDMR